MTSVTVHAIGGGGGGERYDDSNGGAGGGSGGAYCGGDFTVTPGGVVTISIGAGGVGASVGGNGGDGAATTVSGAGITGIFAEGGFGGRRFTVPGGQTGACTAISFVGGKGQQPSLSVSAGSGGGGAGNARGQGSFGFTPGPASVGFGGVGGGPDADGDVFDPLTQGRGGDGSFASAPAQSGQFPGGGGGGAVASDGGNGADGIVVLRFSAGGLDSTPPDWSGAQLTATEQGGGIVRLNWTAATDPSGIEEYVVFRDGAEVGRTGELLLLDGPLGFGTYGYKVEALDTAGNTSADGPVAGITLAPPPIEILVTEQITVSDTVTPIPGLLLEVVETIAVSDGFDGGGGGSGVAPNPIAVLVEPITVSDLVTVEVTPPLDIITLEIDGQLFPGSTFTASAEGFQPGTLVQAFLESDPVLVGEEIADLAGRVTFVITIPFDFPPGPHTLALVGTGPDDAPRRLVAPILVEEGDLVIRDGFED